MGIKLADTLEPMADFPSAYAKDIAFNDGDTLQEKLDTGSLGGGGVGYKQLSQAEYDALTEDEKLDGREYRTYDTGHIYKLGVEYGKDTKLSQYGLVTNAQNFKIDLTKNNAYWYGMFTFNFVYGTTPCEITVTITDKVYYTITKGQNLVSAITYTQDGANYTIGIDLTAKVYGTQVVDMPSEFGVINNLTAETFAGDTTANLKLDSAITYTTLAELGLTADATFQDVVDALPKGSSALLGVKEFTNYQTIFPYEEGNDQFARVHIVKGVADGSSMYARWFRKDGVKEAIAIFNINTNKFDGWQEITKKSIYNSVAELNKAKGTSIELVNGEDNTQKIVDALSVGEQFVSFYHNNANQNRFGIDVNYGNLINEIRITKCLDADLTANYATVTAFMNTGVTMSRIYYKTYSTDWCVNGTITSLSQLGLTTEATLNEVITKLKIGQNATLRTTEFTNYQTLFPYEEEQDVNATVRIEKGYDTSRTIVTWVRKDGSKVAYGGMGGNNQVNWWYEYALKEKFNGKSVKSVTIDLSASDLQSKGSGSVHLSLGNYIDKSTKAIRVEGYYNPPSDSTYPVVIPVIFGSQAGHLATDSTGYTFRVVQSPSGKKGSGFVKIYYVE